MGNVFLDESKKEDPKEIYQQWVEQNPDLVSRKLLTFNKFFETNFFKYCEFSIKMEVFFRRDNTDLQGYLKAFSVIQTLVEKYKTIHILPMRILETKEFKEKEYQNITVAMRQYVSTTLEQKLQSKPTLTQEQKIWIIYQMVFSIYTIHEVFNIYHGSIRTSNFLYNNYLYLYLTDFASYKPTYILQDTERGLREFRLFYASSEDKCNLAPEKIVQKEILAPTALDSIKLFNFNPDQVEKEKVSSTTVSEANSASPKKSRKIVYTDDDCLQQMQKLKMMDMFSLGLAILEVLNDGRSPMAYSDLLRMKKEGVNFGQLIKDSASKLSKGSSAISYLLTNLLNEKPEERLTAEKAQQIITSFVDHQMYYLLWMVLSAFSKSSFSSCDLRIKLIFSLIDFMENKIRGTGYRWINQPPHCLTNFNALRIFVELLDKKNKMIFAPSLVGDKSILDKLLNVFDNSEEVKEISQIKEEVLYQFSQYADQRRKFFIPTAKHNKIAKRLSISVDVTSKIKELCPPSIAVIEGMQQQQQEPVKLTRLGARMPRLQQLLRDFKTKQTIREERIKQPKYYKICEVLIKVLFGTIRGCKYVASKLVALEIISLLGKDCSDSFRLHILLPYLMHLTEDSDLSVSREAFFDFMSLFYDFVDPFNCEQDIHYYQVILQFLANIIRQSKTNKLRPTLFANFKEIFSILEWLQIHYKRFHQKIKIQLIRLLDVLKANYGYFSKEEVKLLLNGNIPEHFLPEMFEFYLSLINTDRIEGLKLSRDLAKSVSPLTHRDILEVFDSCVEGGLEESGMGLVYSIQYFTLRKVTNHNIIRKITLHVINPSKWVRDEAHNYIRMCLNQFPPTKNYFFFRDVFAPPFPLKPEDIEEEVLLPQPLKQSDIDWQQKNLKINEHSPTITLFVEYLKKLKSQPKPDKRRITEKIQKWNQTLRTVQDSAEEGKLFEFENYIKKQLQLLYQYNYLCYGEGLAPYDKEKPEDKSFQLATALKRKGKPLDLTSIDYEKKQLFESFQAITNSSFERLLHGKQKNYGQPVSDKIKLAESMITIGEMFKIRPIPKLGTYVRQPAMLEKITRPKGILISEVFEHTDTVTCLEKVADQFILSGSADGTLRVFNAKKIQANVTMCSEGWVDMRGQGEEKAKISDVASFDQTYAAVVGSNRGQIRVYPIQRFQKSSNANRSDQIVNFTVGAELEKIVTLTNELKNQCFCYITSEGNLGVHDIRLKSRAIGCCIGRERGLPRALCATNRQSILVGTVDGYVINFDVRFNVISSVLQLQNQKQTLPITNIVATPYTNEQEQQLFAFSYPSKYFQFCCFNLQENRQQFGPERQFTSSSPQEIVSTPFFVNRSSDQQFKLCRNSLMWRKSYEQLRDFSKNFNIFDYLSDPLTRKQAKIRQVWLDNSKNRYNQISSLYNKRNLPFLQFMNTGILTSCNPLPMLTQDIRQRPPFALLTERKEPLRQLSELERPLNLRLNSNSSHKVFGFSGEETRQYFTCCKVLPNLIVAGCRNSQLKIYT